jgi:hypothetical protein
MRLRVPQGHQIALVGQLESNKPYKTITLVIQEIIGVNGTTLVTIIMAQQQKKK